MKRFFEVIFSREYASNFMIEITPVWIHRHMECEPYHYHMLLHLGFWFIEIRIGRDTNYV